jgi:hypothetical protein
MNKGDVKDDVKNETAENEPFHVRLPGFFAEEVGLGTLLKRVTYAIGVKPCGGCEQRAAALDRQVVFSGRQSKKN